MVLRLKTRCASQHSSHRELRSFDDKKQAPSFLNGRLAESDLKSANLLTPFTAYADTSAGREYLVETAVAY